jgi:predicted ATPase/DNA-binding CsgD family transcriptional regulator
MADPVFPLVLGSLSFPRSRLIGREAEITAARTFLLDAAIPVLTLTGPGGVGKTRLALAVASALADEFPDGVHFVSLASVLDPTHVPFTVARALGLQDVRSSDPLKQLATVLGGRELLLVLDNLEHLLPAAPWIATLLQICAGVTALVTSRERLRIAGEQEMPVLPLALPDRATPLSFNGLSKNAAIRLFAARTQVSDPAFSLTPENVGVVAEICRRLDGLPLAIELAAAHIKVLPPGALLTRLERRLPLLIGGARDAPSRQRTMRDTIAWSHDLLPTDEQALFRRLAVFAGGCTLEAAAAVSGVSLDTFPLVASLVDRSLLRRVEDDTGEPRFHMLETIREFAWEQLATSGEAEDIHRRHAMWCLAFAQRCNVRDRPSDEVRLGLDRLGAERDNLRAAMAWLLDRSEVETALRLGTELERLWLLRGPSREGRDWLERALAAPDIQRVSPAIRGLAAQAASILAWMEGAFDAAETHAAEALARAREGGAEADGVWALNLRGMAATSLGRYDEAAACLDEALTLYNQLGAGRGIATILTNRAVVADAAHARGYLDEAHALCRQSGAQAIQLAIVLNELGRLACLEGDIVEMGQRFGESLRVCWSTVDLWSLPKTLEGLACLAVSTDQPTRAVHLLAAAAALRERTGGPVMVADRGYYVQIVERARQQLSPDHFASAWEEGHALPLEEVIADALALANDPVSPDKPHATALDREGSTGDEDRAFFGLSLREREVLCLIAAGRSNAEIAHMLFISPRTASTHAGHILHKLGLTTRAELIAFAHRQGLA